MDKFGLPVRKGSFEQHLNSGEVLVGTVQPPAIPAIKPGGFDREAERAVGAIAEVAEKRFRAALDAEEGRAEV